MVNVNGETVRNNICWHYLPLQCLVRAKLSLHGAPTFSKRANQPQLPWRHLPCYFRSGVRSFINSRHCQQRQCLLLTQMNHWMSIRIRYCTQPSLRLLGLISRVSGNKALCVSDWFSKSVSLMSALAIHNVCEIGSAAVLWGNIQWHSCLREDMCTTNSVDSPVWAGKGVMVVLPIHVLRKAPFKKFSGKPLWL